jgi:hypothetical protein
MLHLKHIRHSLKNPGNPAQTSLIADNAHHLMPAMIDLPAHILCRHRRKVHIGYYYHQWLTFLNVYQCS